MKPPAGTRIAAVIAVRLAFAFVAAAVCGLFKPAAYSLAGAP
jgi:hypothetical protein